MQSQPTTWRTEMTVSPGDHVARFEDALADAGEAVTAMETAPGGDWRIEIYSSAAPDSGDLARRIAVAAAAVGIAPPEFIVEPMPDIDWVRRVRENSPPVSAARFYIHGSHVAQPVPDGMIGILIDAGAAFGTGTHETTRGCLIALDGLEKRRRIGNALDLGAGSGILAIAIAGLWDVPVLATDNDPIAVAVCAENAEINGVENRVRAVLSDGFDSKEIGVAAPFDLIAANILARPLAELAPGIAHNLAPGGVAVLSGILDSQADDVLAAARTSGMQLAERIALGEWHTLVISGTKV